MSLGRYRGVQSRTAQKAATALAAALAAVGIAGCGQSSPGTGGGVPKHEGTASVAYAGSLENLNEKTVGPAFSKATGYSYRGRGAGSSALSQEIKSGEITPGVFESIGAGPIEALEPKFTTWYVQFAASPLVLAYNPASRYASEFRDYAAGKKPLGGLFQLLATPGFKLGRTDPNVDPQGAAFIEMLMLAQQRYHLPGDIVTKILGGPPSSSKSTEIFEETALEPRLQAGQLDAASAFLSQAIQLHLNYIPLPGDINLGDPAQAAHYATASFPLANSTVEHGKPLVVDITTIGEPDRAAAAFVAYVLSKDGLALHRAGGYTLLTPTAFGDVGAIPAVVRHELGG
ncbi:substrate-binding domain-containing protein [Mycobacterium sp. SM1]|uniref:extracellular solute-binding protein n=1 Tax=Mycobacterium sp. SM1 TaxID=2816243 RepID=UPI001BCEE6D2|nr:extracellular solute-binding protein [Mycobacterium sp. SM1]MBS4728198.1 substrate-binding domain-containing protein [Mycobacterium sp. SM1]